MKNANIKVLCQTAILIAVYVLLSMTLVIRTGNWKLTFVALPVIIASLSLGTGSGCAVALIGEFLSQMLTFGLMHTIEKSAQIWVLAHSCGPERQTITDDDLRAIAKEFGVTLREEFLS